MARGPMVALLALSTGMCANAADRTIAADAPALAVQFVDGGKAVAAICGDGKVRLWDVESGSLRQTSTKDSFRSPAAFVRRTDGLATVDRDGPIRIWKLNEEAPSREIRAATPRASRLAVSEDGSLVATVHMPDRQSGVNTIHVRDAQGKDLFHTNSGIGGVSILGFSPDGSTLVAGSYDADVRVWSVKNGEMRQLIDTLPVATFAMAFSPDGKWLATAGVDRTVYLWDTRTWKLARKITGQPEMISSLDFSPDGKRLVSGGFSELTSTAAVKLIVWDVDSTKQLRSMPAPRRVSTVAFSPDGKHVASSYGDKTVHIWQLPD